MNYVEAYLEEIARELPDNDPELNELYALLAMTTGEMTMWEDVHEAWAIWRTRTLPEHKSLVPFKELPPHIREYDRKYCEAIIRVAKRLQREDAEWHR